MEQTDHNSSHMQTLNPAIQADLNIKVFIFHLGGGADGTLEQMGAPVIIFSRHQTDSSRNF